jgi:hypothetical protein
MISKNKTYRTRDGREVRIYAIDGGVGKSMVHGATLDEAPGWFPRVWYPDGSHTENGDFDLIEVKPRIKRTFWTNIYGGKYFDPDKVGQAIFFSKEMADKFVIYADRVACVKVEIDCEEGEGL